MCQSCATETVAPACPPFKFSVHEAGEEEALRHKWIESEKAGRDLGESAIRAWIKAHWNGFLRDRWLQHLQGKAYWIELDHDDFGLLQRAFRDSPLIGPILEKLIQGGENLPILIWAREQGFPMEEVIAILIALDINSRRIECQLDRRLSQAG